MYNQLIDWLQNCRCGTMMEAQLTKRKAAILTFSCTRLPSTAILSTWATTDWSSAIRTNTTRNRPRQTTEQLVSRPCKRPQAKIPGSVSNRNTRCSTTTCIHSVGQRTDSPDLKDPTTAVSVPTKSTVATSSRPTTKPASTLVSTSEEPTPKLCRLRYVTFALQSIIRSSAQSSNQDTSKKSSKFKITSQSFNTIK